MIDPTKPVYLKKMLVDVKTGNVYPPLSGRAYNPGELPLHLLNSNNCTQAVDLSNMTLNDVPTFTATGYQHGMVDIPGAENSNLPIIEPSPPTRTIQASGSDYKLGETETRTLKPESPKPEPSKPEFKEPKSK